ERTEEVRKRRINGIPLLAGKTIHAEDNDGKNDCQACDGRILPLDECFRTHPDCVGAFLHLGRPLILREDTACEKARDDQCNNAYDNDNCNFKHSLTSLSCYGTPVNRLRPDLRTPLLQNSRSDRKAITYQV